jgi:hypothetical protein
MSLSKCRLWLTVAAALWWTAQTSAADLGANAMAAGSRKANHERAAEPTVKTALLPLPPGAVELSGFESWLLYIQERLAVRGFEHSVPKKNSRALQTRLPWKRGSFVKAGW